MVKLRIVIRLDLTIQLIQRRPTFSRGIKILVGECYGEGTDWVI